MAPKLTKEARELYESIKEYDPAAARRYLIYYARWNPHKSMCFECGSYRLSPVVPRRLQGMSRYNKKFTEHKDVLIKHSDIHLYYKPKDDIDYVCLSCNKKLTLKVVNKDEKQQRIARSRANNVS